MVYSTRRFVVCLSVCHFVLVFFSPFSIAITSLGEERANLGVFRTSVRFVLVWICRFPLPLGVWEGLQFVIVALSGLFSYLFMQVSWLRKKADEMQSFADRKDMKKFFDSLKTVYGPQSSGTTPLLTADGTSLLTDKEAILKRSAEYFDGVLNRPSSINDEAINRLPQVECNSLLDELPAISETVKAIKLLSSGKAPGSDAIPAEIYKAVGPPAAEKLTELFHIMWRQEAIPQEFKDATIIRLYKRKGNPQVCDNYRGIFFLSVAGRILARVLRNRLNEHLERSGLLPESQCGFRKNRGTIDMIFTARQLQGKC